MTKPENLIHSDFMHNLGSDHLAVAANGHVVGRAGSAESIRRAVPDAAHYLTVKDFIENHEEIKGEVGKEFSAAEEPNPVAAGLDAVKAQGALAPNADVKADKDLDAKAAKSAVKKPGAAK